MGELTWGERLEVLGELLLTGLVALSFFGAMIGYGALCHHAEAARAAANVTVTK